MRFVGVALILFLTYFLNVFLPGHTRGAITLAGTKTESVMAEDSCCAQKDKSHVPTPEERRGCLVCYIALGFLPVEPIIVELKLRESIELAHDLVVAQVRSHEYPLPFWPAGPPAV